jgi:hypothetical protein
MKKSQAKPLNIGDKVYKYLSLHGVMTYEVIGKREYRENIQYELQCKNCKHGYPCELLITLNDNGRYVYVAMLNDDEEDPQYYFHIGEPFFLAKQEALINKGEVHISEYKLEINKLKTQLSEKEKALKELEVYVESLYEELKIDRRDE